MADVPRRVGLLLLFRERLSAITVANGFATDAGLDPDDIHLGYTPELGDGSPDYAVAVLIGEETPTHVMENVAGITPVEIQAVAKAHLDERYLIAEQVLADVKRAVELQDRRLSRLASGFMTRGTSRTIPSEPGSPVVGLSITYLVPYVEAWGNP